ncbi:hypothetical protein HU200_007182 [Digitaria exilis]|uniref:Uncharacterized protein n=1 Tax=Digitaria exilis TaxID=1010633 RepID=A0A835FND7_9POAL|nr:hypothetical protein HU200_007182 [Digitaria exilis]
MTRGDEEYLPTHPPPNRSPSPAEKKKMARSYVGAAWSAGTEEGPAQRQRRFNGDGTEKEIAHGATVQRHSINQLGGGDAFRYRFCRRGVHYGGRPAVATLEHVRHARNLRAHAANPTVSIYPVEKERRAQLWKPETRTPALRRRGGESLWKAPPETNRILCVAPRPVHHTDPSPTAYRQSRAIILLAHECASRKSPSAQQQREAQAHLGSHHACAFRASPSSPSAGRPRELQLVPTQLTLRARPLPPRPRPIKSRQPGWRLPSRNRVGTVHAATSLSTR